MREAAKPTHPEQEEGALGAHLPAYLLTYLLTYLYLVKMGGRTQKKERPGLHDDVGRWTLNAVLSFLIIRGEGDSLLAPPHADGS